MKNLKGVIEGRIALRLRLGLAIPPINGHSIETPTKAEEVVWAYKCHLTVDLQNPHKQDIGVGLLKKVLESAPLSLKL